MKNNFTTLASQELIDMAMENLSKNGIESMVVDNGELAMQKIKELIPVGASVMNGSSKTLEQVGYIDYLKSGTHGWNNLKDTILAEQDPERQKLLRRQSVVSDWYLGSVHALAASTGEILIASNSGSQLPHLVYTSPNIILVVGAQKVVANMQEAWQRLEDYVYPLENERMLKVTQGKSGSQISKVLVFKKEPSFMGRKVQVIIVKEPLGF